MTTINVYDGLPRNTFNTDPILYSDYHKIYSPHTESVHGAAYTADRNYIQMVDNSIKKVYQNVGLGNYGPSQSTCYKPFYGQQHQCIENLYIPGSDGINEIHQGYNYTEGTPYDSTAYTLKHNRYNKQFKDLPSCNEIYPRDITPTSVEVMNIPMIECAYPKDYISYKKSFAGMCPNDIPCCK